MRMRGNLTKKFLMSLQSDIFVQSNCLGSDMTPIFAECVALPNRRLEQWERVKAAGADGRLCYVHRSKTDFEDYFEATIRPAFEKHLQRKGVNT